MTRIRVALVFAALALCAFAFATPANAATEARSGSGAGADAGKAVISNAAGPVLGQVTVDPNAPSRVYQENEDKPWTLWMAKGFTVVVLLLLVAVVVWYAWKMVRVRSVRS